MKYFLFIISDLHFSLSRKNVIYVQYIHYTNVFVGMPNSRLSSFNCTDNASDKFSNWIIFSQERYYTFDEREGEMRGLHDDSS